jgi:C4-dicarboxylate transporter DctM subunit
VASAITGLSLEEISKPIIPMIIALVVVFLIVTYFPVFSLALPKLAYGFI